MKVCEFCGTLCKDQDAECASCGGNSFLNRCNNCGEDFKDAYCPKCGTKAGQTAHTCPRCGTKYFSPACPNCGYIRGQATNNSYQPKTIPHLGWWIAGWILFFPIPLTILIVRNQKLSKPMKIAILVALWAVILIIGAADTAKDIRKEREAQQAAQSQQQTTAYTVPTEDFQYE